MEITNVFLKGYCIHHLTSSFFLKTPHQKIRFNTTNKRITTIARDEGF